jgi:hypothetical protein
MGAISSVQVQGTVRYYWLIYQFYTILPGSIRLPFLHAKKTGVFGSVKLESLLYKRVLSQNRNGIQVAEIPGTCNNPFPLLGKTGQQNYKTNMALNLIPFHTECEIHCNVEKWTMSCYQLAQQVCIPIIERL